MTTLNDLKWVNLPRSEVIGGTDMAVILGQSKWKTPDQLLLEKQGLHWTKETEAMGWGLRLEAPIAACYLERNTSCQWTQRPDTDVYLFEAPSRRQQIQHPSIPYFVGSPDRLVCKKKTHKLVRGLEIKTSNEFMKKQWDQGVPKNYNTQCQFYMMVSGLSTWDVACLVGGNKYYQFTLEKEPFLHEEMMDAGTRFYEKMKGAQDGSEERSTEPEGSGGVCIPFGGAT